MTITREKIQSYLSTKNSRPVLFRVVLIGAALVGIILFSFRVRATGHVWTTATIRPGTAPASLSAVCNTARGECGVLSGEIFAGTHTLRFATTSNVSSWSDYEIVPQAYVTSSLGNIAPITVSPDDGYALLLPSVDAASPGSSAIFATSSNGSDWNPSMQDSLTGFLSPGTLLYDDVNGFYAYAAGNGTNLIFATSTNNTTFSTSVLTTSPTGFDKVSMDRKGNAYAVAYVVSGDPNLYLMLSVNGGQSWTGTSYSVDGTWAAIHDMAITMDDAGSVHMAYTAADTAAYNNGQVDCTLGACNLFYALYTTSTSWNIFPVDEAISHVDIKVVSSTPLISYYSVAANAALRYAYQDSGNTGCSLVNGSGFSCATVVSGLGNTSNSPISLALLGTEAFIAFENKTAGSIQAAFASFAASGAVTVCGNALQCDYTTISAAVSDPSLSSGGTLQVLSSYEAGIEPNSITLPAGVIVDCVNNAPIIGKVSATTTVTLSAGSAIQQCSLLRTEITLANTVNILSNTFSTSSPSILYTNSTVGATISNNTSVSEISRGGGETGLVIDGNAFVGNTMRAIFTSSTNVTSAQITNNTFTLQDVSSLTTDFVVSGEINFSSNTINITAPTPAYVDGTIMQITGGTVTFNGNFIHAAFPTTQSLLLFSSGSSGPLTLSFSHNTLFASTTANSPLFVQTSASQPATVGLSYNLFYNDAGSGYVEPGVTFWQQAGQTISLDHSYNGFYGFTTNSTPFGVYLDSMIVPARDPSETLVNPYLRLNNTTTTDDLIPAPWSSYFDVFGSEDIGAFSAARSSTFYINATGTIDYETVHATSSEDIFGSLRNGDRVEFSAGEYTFPTITSSSVLTSGLTIHGVGSGYASSTATIFSQQSWQQTPMAIRGVHDVTISDISFDEHGMMANGVFELTDSTSSSLSNLLLYSSNAWIMPNTGLYLDTVSSSTFSQIETTNTVKITPLGDQYFAGDSLYSYAGHRFDELYKLGEPGSSVLVYSGSSCTMQSFSSGYFEVTDYVKPTIFSAPENWHIALAHVSSTDPIYITVLVPNNFATESGSVVSDCTNVGGQLGQLYIDQWIPDVFTVTNTTYIYNSSSLATAGVTVLPDYDQTPYLTKGHTYAAAGIYLKDASANTFTSVTTTNGNCGISFVGSSQNNTAYNFYSSDNDFGFVCSSVNNGYNILRDPLFSGTNYFDLTPASTLYIQFQARAYATISGDPVENALVSFRNAATTETTTLYTGMNGYTSDTPYMTSLIVRGSDPVPEPGEELLYGRSVTTGGSNPITVSALFIGGYAGSITENLITANQVFSLSLTVSETASVPARVTAHTNGQSSITVSWVGDAYQYYVEEENNTQMNSGWIGGTSYTFNSLTCATSYTFHVKARTVLGQESEYSGRTYLSTIQSGVNPANLSVTRNNNRSEYGILFSSAASSSRPLYFASLPDTEMNWSTSTLLEGQTYTHFNHQTVAWLTRAANGDYASFAPVGPGQFGTSNDGIVWSTTSMSYLGFSFPGGMFFDPDKGYYVFNNTNSSGDVVFGTTTSGFPLSTMLVVASTTPGGFVNDIHLTKYGSAYAIAYTRSGEPTLYVATSNNAGTVWTHHDIETNASNLADFSLTTDNAGVLWLAYTAFTNDQSVPKAVFLARMSNQGVWTTEKVDSITSESSVNSFSHVSLALINGITPFVAYYDQSTTSSLRYAYRNNGNTGCTGTDSVHYTCVTVDNDLGTLDLTNLNPLLSVEAYGSEALITYASYAPTSTKSALLLFGTPNAATTSACVVSSGSSSSNNTKPTISSFSINGGATSTASTTVLLRLSAQNATQMKVSLLSSLLDVVWQTYQPSFSFLLDSVLGMKPIFVKVLGDGGESAAIVQYITLLASEEAPKVLPPPAPIVSVPFAYASSPKVLLTLGLDKAAAEMMISNSDSFARAVWEPIARQKQWTVPSGDGVKNVYVKIRNAEGVSSAPGSASFILDTIPPTKPSIIEPIQNTKIVAGNTKIRGTADATASFILRILSGNIVVSTQSPTLGAGGGWEYSTSTLKSGAYVVEAISTDEAGNSNKTDVAFTVYLGEPLAKLSIDTPTDGLVLSNTTIVKTNGKGFAKALVVASVGGKQLASSLVGDNGTWQMKFELPEVNATYAIDYQMIDADNNFMDSLQRSITLAFEKIIVSPTSTEKTTTTLNTDFIGAKNEVIATVRVSTGEEDVFLGSASTTDVAGTSTRDLLLSLPLRMVSQDIFSSSTVETVRVLQDAVGKTVERAVTQSKKIATETAAAVQQVVQTPAVQIANQGLVVPAVAVAGAASLGTAVNGISLLNYVQFLFTQPLFLLTKRKRKGWGIAYNAITKMPIDLAMVRIVDIEKNKVVQSRVTDIGGRYQLFADPGKYAIEVTKQDYVFPSTSLKGQTDDGKFVDLYTGGDVALTEASHISYNLPLEPIGINKSSKELLREATKKRLGSIVAASGMVLTGISFAISPTPLVGAFLVGHIASFAAFRRIAGKKKPDVWALVRDAETLKPIAQVIVRVFDAKYNKLVDSQVTGAAGKYAFLVGKNEYFIRVEKEGYEPVTLGPLQIQSHEDVGILCQEVLLKKITTAAPPVQPTPTTVTV